MAQRFKQKESHPKATLMVAGFAAAALLGWGAFSLTKDSSIGRNAVEEVTRIVALGPRPCGSDAHRKEEALITGKLQAAGISVEQDRFKADTPIGPVAMNNIIGRIPGRGGNGPGQRTIVLATHYDTKLESKFQFVGANDGGSGTGLLLALGPQLAKRGYNHNVWLVFLDGEEAFGDWQSGDPLSGSKHFAEQLKSAGTVSQIGAFILLDMIGDADLGILKDTNSTPWLRDLVWNAAGRLGYSKYFLNTRTGMEDDHIPLLQVGVPSVDLIDFDYGKGNAYWHTALDTVDKLSAQSLQIVGDVVLEVIAQLDRTG